uniref:Uncharacterized protein n=1 Tax=Gopherus evgoodei TaxID=1825980 RepID=A0A8C4YQK5_9SAUR
MERESSVVSCYLPLACDNIVTNLRIVKEFGKDVLPVDGRKLFCTICSKVLDRVKKDHIFNHIKGPCHIAAMEKRKQKVENSDETAVKKQLTTTEFLNDTPREIDLPCVFELNKQQLVTELKDQHVTVIVNEYIDNVNWYVANYSNTADAGFRILPSCC